MVDFKQLIALFKENEMSGIFSTHCEYLTDMDELPVKIQQIKKDIFYFKGLAK